MGYRNREVEIKVCCFERTLPEMHEHVEGFINSFYPDADYIIGYASDLYWHTPDQSSGDFVRLRRTSGKAAQITMKATDRGDNTDRVEIDLEVEDYDQAKKLMLGVHGEPLGSVRKKYHVYFLENDDTTVSVYRVDKDNRVFIEFEARTEKRAKELVSAFQDYSDSHFYDGRDAFSWVGSSIYDMFVDKSDMINKPLDEWMGE